MILQMTLLLFMAAAAVKDYRSYWVPNELILVGALNGYILRFWADGSGGVIDGAAGMVLIFILCAGFFVLSMFGAGDLKLMIAMAVYMGPVKSVRILIVSLVFGAVISLLKMLKYDICRERFRYLLHYAQRIQRHGAEPYMDMSHLQGREHCIIPFAVPLFLALAAEVVVWNIGSL